MLVVINSAGITMNNICIELHIAMFRLFFIVFKNIFFAEIKVLISHIAHDPNYMNLEKRTTQFVFLDEKKVYYSKTNLNFKILPSFAPNAQQKNNPRIQIQQF